jgi:hypothetical protein
MDLVIGATVMCTDGEYGRLTHVVVDPVAKQMRAIVVQPKHRVGLGRRIDPSLIETSSKKMVRLRCSRQDLDAQSVTESTAFVDPESNRVGQPVPAAGWRGTSPDLSPDVVTRVDLRAGEIALGQLPVMGLGGRDGQLEGLRIRSSDLGITDLLINEGRLLRREVTVPSSTAVFAEDRIDLSISDSASHEEA